MAFSTDSDLITLVPDILELGITSFSTEHAKAEADLMRELRINWSARKGLENDLDRDLLDTSQFTRCSAYLVLWKYALPKLTNWVDGDRYQSMITFYKSRYGEELESIFKDGVKYDENDDGTVTEEERNAIDSGRLNR